MYCLTSNYSAAASCLPLACYLVAALAHDDCYPHFPTCPMSNRLKIILLSFAILVCGLVLLFGIVMDVYMSRHAGP